MGEVGAEGPSVCAARRVLAPGKKGRGAYHRLEAWQHGDPPEAVEWALAWPIVDAMRSRRHAKKGFPCKKSGSAAAPQVFPGLPDGFNARFCGKKKGGEAQKQPVMFVQVRPASQARPGYPPGMSIY